MGLGFRISLIFIARCKVAKVRTLTSWVEGWGFATCKVATTETQGPRSKVVNLAPCSLAPCKVARSKVAKVRKPTSWVEGLGFARSKIARSKVARCKVQAGN